MQTLANGQTDALRRTLSGLTTRARKKLFGRRSTGTTVFAASGPIVPRTDIDAFLFVTRCVLEAA
jgi:hypothetical protein